MASFASISGFGANDAIALTANAQNLVAVASQGRNVILTVNVNGTVSSIVLQNIISTGQVVYDVASFNALPVGDIRFNGLQMPQTVSLDSIGGTLAFPATMEASWGSFTFSDDAALPSVVQISGFGADDKIDLIRTDINSVAVSSKGGNANLVINQNGAISSITLINVVPSGSLVYDVNSFNALPVGNVHFQ